MNTLLSISAFSVLSLATEMFGFRKQTVWLVLLGLLASLGVCLSEWGTTDTPIFGHGMLVINDFSRAFIALILAVAALLVLLSGRFYDTFEVNRAESYALMLFSLAGAATMLSFGNLVMLFLGIELLSIPVYVLAGSDKTNLLSNEASLKYFLMGAFATSFLLFGIALVYGASGSFDLIKISEFAIANAGHTPALFGVGILLIIIAMAFKVSAAPLHFWAPDVYDGAPTLVTMFMATIVKIAAFGTFVKLFAVTFAPNAAEFSSVLAWLAALTMTVGNLSAVFQSSFKRMMAYSGVAHAGYLLLGLLFAKTAGSAVLFYSVAYCAATVSAFTVLLLLYYQSHSEEGDSFAGLGKKHPVLAAVATIALLSLAGIPPFAGFFGKYYLFAQSINGGRPEGRLVLNKMKRRGAISRELQTAAPELGLVVTKQRLFALSISR